LLIIIVYVIVPLLAQSVYAQEIFDAVRSGDMAKVKELVEKDPQLVKARNARQSTPLHVAVDLEQQLIAGYLLEKGAFCAIVTPDGRYLFFVCGVDGKYAHFWVDASFIEELRPKE